jgi:hypothetical protein
MISQLESGRELRQLVVFSIRSDTAFRADIDGDVDER